MIRRYLDGQSADAEAAAWIARLQSSERSEATEAALRSWLEAAPENQDAFERATDVWGVIPSAALLRPRLRTDAAPVPPASRQRPGGTLTQPRALALAASLLLFVCAGMGWWIMNRPVHYTTERGEQKVATLADGTRISLNTRTTLSVRYEDDVRKIRLEHGEAMFEVAPNPDRPFIVTAGSKSVRALGTSFVVKRVGNDVTVTLIEGSVSVDDGREADTRGAPDPVVLNPGERLKVETKMTSIDRPSLQAVTAWRRGQAVFDNVPLSTAVAELNRYGGPRISIDDPRLASLRVSGVFATNDTVEFARAIAALYGLRVERADGELRLVR